MRTRPVWDGDVPLDAPPLAGDRATEVCVVGLGGSGLSAVRRLQDRGIEVIGVDAGRIGSGASGRNGGFLLGGTARFHHRMVAQIGHARAAAIYRATLEELDRMTGETPHLIRRVGSLRIAGSDEELQDCAVHRDALVADGIAVADYDGPEGRGLLLPDDGAFDPASSCRTTANRLVAGGVELHEETRAVRVGDGAVVTGSGAIRCEEVVVAIDGGLEAVLPELQGRVRTARAQMLATAPLDEDRFPRPVYRRWGYEYHQQLPDGRVVLGGFRDRGGEAEWTLQAVTSEPVQALLDEHLRRVLEVDAPVTHRWAGSIAYTDDGLPVLEEVRDGVVATGAYSGTGNLIGRLAGRAAADLAVDGRSELAELLASAV